MRALSEPAVPALRASDLDTDLGRAAYQLGRRRGLAEGRAQGISAGRAQAEAERAQAEDMQRACALDALDALAAAFGDALSARERALADEAAALALAIARQVLRRELPQPETVQAVAREALQCLAGEAALLTLHVHPSQAGLLEPLQRARGTASLTLQPDASIEPGGCRLAGPPGEVDATVGARWEAVFACLGWPEGEPR